MERERRSRSLGVIGEVLMRGDDGSEVAKLTGYRFHFMWEYLGLPWKDIEIVPKEEGKAKL